jgi:lysophospholipase L1-like esterase
LRPASSYKDAASVSHLPSLDGASGSTPSGSTTNRLNSAATTEAATANTYAALGDSVAAGLGLPLVANPTDQDTQCGRSSQAYAQQVAQNRGLSLSLIACSGATAGDLSTQQHTDGPNPQRQIKTAFANGTPSLITVTAGANDIHWADYIKKCYAMTCGTKLDDAAADTLIAAVRVKLTYFLAEVKTRSIANQTGTPTVVLTGYYDPVSEQCETATNSKITKAEADWINTKVTRLNQAIQNATNGFSFAHYAAVDFTGHDICSADPWVQGLNDAAPIHPTQTGQQAIANAVLGQL